MNRAAIDIGSNSLLLTVVDPEGRVLADEATVVGLGKGLGDGGRFRPDRVEAAVEVLRRYRRVADNLGAPIRAVATSGARRATDVDAFLHRVAMETGIEVEVISGDEEARLSWLGAFRGLKLPHPLLIDLGGGSTELNDGAWRVSLELGSVRLTEAGATREQIRAAIPDLPPVKSALAVAGTATTLAAIDLGLDRFDDAAVHGHRLSRRALADLAERLGAASPEERRRIARVSPERADYLQAGAWVIGAVLERAGLPGCVVSTGGLRFGVLADPP